MMDGHPGYPADVRFRVSMIHTIVVKDHSEAALRCITGNYPYRLLVEYIGNRLPRAHNTRGNWSTYTGMKGS